MKQTDVLVVGGGPAGIIAATTARSSYPEKKVIMVREDADVLVPCGIPYVFGSLDGSAKNIIPNAPLEKAGVELILDRVKSIEMEKKRCELEGGEKIGFDKLIFATGSKPAVPKWLKGAELENVFTISKNKAYIDKMLEKLEACEKIVTVGGGFIGVEVSDELNKRGKDVTLVEILPHVLGLVFDEEIASEAEQRLIERGVSVKTGVGVKEIIGNGKVGGLLLDDGTTIDADAVILSMGYSPRTELAKEMGLEIAKNGCIVVDEYMRANDDIFAVGDCAEKRGFTTRKLSAAMLASTACAEARIAGMNIYGLSTIKTFSGTIAIFSTAIGDTGFGAAGLTEQRAKKEGFEVLTASFKGIDKHPGSLPGTHHQLVKLIVARDSGTILGGEIVGGPSTGELLNTIGVAIQKKTTVSELLTMQIGTHPLLTAPPTAYPLTKAAEMAVRKMRQI